MKMNKISPKQIKWWRKAIGISSLIILIGLMSLYTVDVNEKRDQKLKDLHGDFESLIKEYQMIKDKITMLSQEQSSKETKERKKRSSEPYHTETYTASGGGVYIRWGRMICPTDNETELVYKGIGGGSHYTHEGGATEVVCLPDQPEWGKYDDASTGYAFMYGMEYEDNMDGILDHSNVQGTLANQNVPCAVCRSKIRPSALMIPGKHSCFEGWNFEYKGYIMAGHYTHKAGSKYICLDEAPEADPAGYRDENGALLYRVEMQCGSAPCPQYVQNRELTCVVCTK